jgi:SAM-dependent methyltransferase
VSVVRWTEAVARRDFTSPSVWGDVDSHDVRNGWAERSGEYSPAYYAHYGPDDRSELVRDALDSRLDADAAVLELGCSSGRHLAHLADHGFGNLTGVDINDEAFDVMAEQYPALATEGTFHCGPIEDVVVGFDDGQFDAVFSVETLQHLHPDVEWVFEEVARITDSVLVTVENEGDEPADGSGTSAPRVNYVREDLPLYYRNWNRVFTDLGFATVDTVRGDRDVARVFRAPG